ncbi:hypothetical protein MUP79_02805, partial [Candidatus Bathyarchaeota archaeon]|nr:hypothetical protein [Candidatus Bathyarchaeota archaeon]
IGEGSRRQALAEIEKLGIKNIVVWSRKPPEETEVSAEQTSFVIEYGIKCASTKGKMCSASKDMILVKHDGEVGLCADFYNYRLGNIFDPSFKLRTQPIRCPTTVCGGDYGMLHLTDDRFGSLPMRLGRDTFVSLVEEVPQTSPVAYPNREEMLKWLEVLKRQK